MIELASKCTCTGCGACANICPHNAILMEEDKEGFLFPEINKDVCVECKLCQRTCPILTSKSNENNNLPETYAYWNLLDRTKSSSGGAFSAIARWILDNGGVVFGAAFDEKLNVNHIAIKEESDLNLLRGSKYIQSHINDTFRQVKSTLKEGKWVLFTGTPCQIAGIKSCINARLTEKLILVDIACHGVPSQKLFKCYIQKVEKRIHTRIQSFRFRKLNGWGFLSSATTSNDKISLLGINNLYMYAFDKGCIFRKSCYQCPFACIPRQGDLTIADYWGIGRHGDKFNKSTMRGISLILVNNKKGESLLKEINSVIPHFIEKRQLKEAVIENGNLVASSVIQPEREEIISDFLNPDISLEQINKKYSLVPHGVTYIIKKFTTKWGIIDYVKELYSLFKRL